MNFKKHLFLFAGILSCSFTMAQQPSDILSVSASTKLEKASLAFDKDTKTMWEVNGQDLKAVSLFIRNIFQAVLTIRV